MTGTHSPRPTDSRIGGGGGSGYKYDHYETDSKLGGASNRFNKKDPLEIIPYKPQKFESDRESNSRHLMKSGSGGRDAKQSDSDDNYSKLNKVNTGRQTTTTTNDPFRNKYSPRGTKESSTPSYGNRNLSKLGSDEDLFKNKYSTPSKSATIGARNIKSISNLHDSDEENKFNSKNKTKKNNFDDDDDDRKLKSKTSSMPFGSYGGGKSSSKPSAPHKSDSDDEFDNKGGGKDKYGGGYSSNKPKPLSSRTQDLYDEYGEKKFVRKESDDDLKSNRPRLGAIGGGSNTQKSSSRKPVDLSDDEKYGSGLKKKTVQNNSDSDNDKNKNKILSSRPGTAGRPGQIGSSLYGDRKIKKDSDDELPKYSQLG